MADHDDQRRQAVALAWHHVLDAHEALRRGAPAHEIAERLRGIGTGLTAEAREVLVAELALAAAR